MISQAGLFTRGSKTLLEAVHSSRFTRRDCLVTVYESRFTIPEAFIFMSRFHRIAISLAIICWCVQLGAAQRKPEPQPPQATDVLRINTELVQTDVTVLDKQGRFVDGLLAEQFELTLDGKSQPITFFERINT